MKISLLQSNGKVDERRFCEALESTLASLKGDLAVEAKIQSLSKHGRAVVEVNGVDSEIFITLVSRKFGLVPSEISRIEKHANYQGSVKIFNSDLIVDIGIEHPTPVHVTVKLSTLRAQLADGKGSVPAREIAESYCLFPETPVSVRVTRAAREKNELEGWLSDSQISTFSNWINCGLERVQVYNCLPSQLDLAIRKARLERDIVSREQLSLTTHSILCKTGTDAVGVIPTLGSILRQSELKPFIPKRIQERCREWIDEGR
jgi:hypothetical protein